MKIEPTTIMAVLIAVLLSMSGCVSKDCKDSNIYSNDMVDAKIIMYDYNNTNMTNCISNCENIYWNTKIAWVETDEKECYSKSQCFSICEKIELSKTRKSEAWW